MNGTHIFTTLGIGKITAASASSEQVKITHIALGDGNGAAYAPSANQVALRRERLRTEIERRYLVGDNAWHVSATCPMGSASTTVREMGFLDAEGDLIALWAGEDVGDGRQTGAADYVINHVIAFNGAGDAVIVEAPDDDLVDHSVAVATALADLQRVQLEQSDQIGTQIVALGAHRVGSDPHKQYLTTARGDGRYYTQPQADQALAQAAASVRVPAGQVMQYAGTGTPPGGYLRCDGAAVSRTDYADLFAAIGTTYGAGDGATTFAVPDTRGLFARDLDDGAGIDAGRVIGAVQGDEIAAHKHGMTFCHETGGNRDGAGYPPLDATAPTAVHADTEPDGSAAQPDGSGTPMHSYGGAETRPKNIAFRWFIKT